MENDMGEWGGLPGRPARQWWPTYSAADTCSEAIHKTMVKAVTILIMAGSGRGELSRVRVLRQGGRPLLRQVA